MATPAVIEAGTTADDVKTTQLKRMLTGKEHKKLRLKLKEAWPAALTGRVLVAAAENSDDLADLLNYYFARVLNKSECTVLKIQLKVAVLQGLEQNKENNVGATKELSYTSSQAIVEQHSSVGSLKRAAAAEPTDVAVNVDAWRTKGDSVRARDVVRQNVRFWADEALASRSVEIGAQVKAGLFKNVVNFRLASGADGQIRAIDVAKVEIIVEASVLRDLLFVYEDSFHGKYVSFNKAAPIITDMANQITEVLRDDVTAPIHSPESLVWCAKVGDFTDVSATTAEANVDVVDFADPDAFQTAQLSDIAVAVGHRLNAAGRAHVKTLESEPDVESALPANLARYADIEQRDAAADVVATAVIVVREERAYDDDYTRSLAACLRSLGWRVAILGSDVTNSSIELDVGVFQLVVITPALYHGMAADLNQDRATLHAAAAADGGPLVTPSLEVLRDDWSQPTLVISQNKNSALATEVTKCQSMFFCFLGTELVGVQASARSETAAVLLAEHPSVIRATLDVHNNLVTKPTEAFLEDQSTNRLAEGEEKATAFAHSTLDPVTRDSFGNLGPFEKKDLATLIDATPYNMTELSKFPQTQKPLPLHGKNTYGPGADPKKWSVLRRFVLLANRFVFLPQAPLHNAKDAALRELSFVEKSSASRKRQRNEIAGPHHLTVDEKKGLAALAQVDPSVTMYNDKLFSTTKGGLLAVAFGKKLVEDVQRDLGANFEEACALRREKWKNWLSKENAGGKVRMKYCREDKPCRFSKCPKCQERRTAAACPEAAPLQLES